VIIPGAYYRAEAVAVNRARLAWSQWACTGNDIYQQNCENERDEQHPLDMLLNVKPRTRF
jgi:hypothetical protein